LHVALFDPHPNAAASPKRRAAQAHRVRISAEYGQPRDDAKIA